MTDKEAMKLALDALETLMIERGSIYEKAIAALKERLAQTEPIQSLQCFHCQVTIETLNDKVMQLMAQPEQEPVAWLVEFENGEQELHFDEQSVGEIHTPLYSIPPAPQRTWVGLTEEDRAEILSRKWWDFEDEFDVDGFLRLAEAKLKEKNNA